MNTNRDELELLSKPGDTISETLNYIRMSQVELAERMGRTPSKINDIISGKEPITNSTAIQLEKVLGIDAQFWLNLEMIYREKLSRLAFEESLVGADEWLETQPIKELKKYGFIKSKKIGSTMADEFLTFYGVASTKQWENVYVNNYVTANFRKSTIRKTLLGSIAAWLRIGEIEMRRHELPAYNKELFKQALNKSKSLIRSHPEDFAIQLRNFCCKAGVSVAYTMCISKAPVSGATRWIGGNPLLQLSDRYKTNDQFWFTFFHEAGHILLHGKKDIFIEEFEGYNNDSLKEAEADEFAVQMLYPEDILEQFKGEVDEKNIKLYARKHNTHPGVIIGFLQHNNIVPYSYGNVLKTKVLLDEVITKNIL